jgi:hypothetical protein
MTALRSFLAAAIALCAASTAAQETLTLRLGGKDVAMSSELRAKLGRLAREMLRQCGPNTQQHPGNFGLAAVGVEQRWKRMLEESRLRIVFSEPFVSQSHLGGTLGVSEAIVGLEHSSYFVGPTFTRHGMAFTEHLQCEYLPALELACLPELAPHLPAGYRETCAKLERDDKGRIVMPPPDIAPSCS